MSDDLVKRARHNALSDMPHYASVELIEALADRIEGLEANLAKAVEALERVDEASNHYCMTPTYSEGTLRYAHKSTRNLARTTIAELTGDKDE